MHPALLFDLDGTLLHSDPLHAAVFIELFAARGRAIDDGFYLREIHGRQNIDIFSEHFPDEDPHALSEAKEAAIGLADRFATLIIGDECARGKPDPAPYIAAMKALQVAPERSIAFEDSPSGMRAAQASGALAIGIRSSLSDAALRSAGAAATIQDFKDPALPALLARAGTPQGAQTV